MANARRGRRGAPAGAAPQDEQPPKKLNKAGFKVLRKTFGFFKPYAGYFTIGMICLVLGSNMLMVFPYGVGRLLDIASGEEAVEWFLTDVNTIALAILGLFALQAVLSYFRVYLFAIVGEKSIADIRQSLYQRFMSLPMAFYDDRRTGELISRITSDIALLQNTFTTILAELIRQVVVLAVGIGFILFLTPRLTVFMLAIVPVLVIVAMIFGRFIRKLSKRTQDELAKTNVIVEETLSSINVIKAFTSEQYERNRYKGSIQELVKVALLNARYRGGFISFTIVALFGSIAAVIWYGATLVQAGQLSIGDLVAFAMYTLFIAGSVGGLGDIYTQLQRAVGASERVLDILDEDTEMDLGQQEPAPVPSPTVISYQDVHFTYPTRPDQEVLRGISFSIKQGDRVALVGHSGAGKSTVAQLLMRFYNVNKGGILFDGQDIKGFELRAYRHLFGIVPQEVVLFGGTIKENIAYGRPEATNAEVEEAARKANVLQFTNSFTDGLETVVGERGVKLSGGQRQRIAIARAILKDPEILILDEATSSLDAESEHLVQQALEQLMHNRTTIIIAHRLATIRQADRIYVLDQGQIIEQGTHHELLENSQGTYNNLVKLQLQDN